MSTTTILALIGALWIATSICVCGLGGLMTGLWAWSKSPEHGKAGAWTWRSTLGMFGLSLLAALLVSLPGIVAVGAAIWMGV